MLNSEEYHKTDYHLTLSQTSDGDDDSGNMSTSISMSAVHCSSVGEGLKAAKVWRNAVE